MNKYDATIIPVVRGDDAQGYSTGSVWVDVTNDKSYICVDASAGAAIWKKFTFDQDLNTTDEVTFNRVIFETRTNNNIRLGLNNSLSYQVIGAIVVGTSSSSISSQDYSIAIGNNAKDIGIEGIAIGSLNEVTASN